MANWFGSIAGDRNQFGFKIMGYVYKGVVVSSFIRNRENKAFAINIVLPCMAVDSSQRRGAFVHRITCLGMVRVAIESISYILQPRDQAFVEL